MSKKKLFKIIFIFTSIVAVAVGQHLFESLLQRRAKPIRWKWSNDLERPIKPPDLQRRRRFLTDTSKEKWWRTMAPQKDEKSDTAVAKDEVEDTFFRQQPHADHLQTQRLTETSVSDDQNSIIVNQSQSFKETSLVNRVSPFEDSEILSLPVEPFDKGNKYIIVADYLSPTEKTYLSDQNFPDVVENFQNIPHEVENNNYDTTDTEEEKLFSSQHDSDTEFLREAIIHERHKPSKFEIQSASQRLKDSSRTGKNFRDSNKQVMSSVEYIVPSVEHVVSHVEYADNISSSEEFRIPGVLPSVEYVTPIVEFVEPEVEYASHELNTSLKVESPKENDAQWFGTGDTPEDTLPNDNLLLEKYENENLKAENAPEESLPKDSLLLEKYKNEGLKAENDGTRFRIVALRREQIRVRRNHRKHNEFGGIPEQDYPTLEALPVVQFYCGDYAPGYYVDITTRCQVFHICHENGQRNSFLCPVGTVFNQEYLVCDWWYNVDCESSSRFYISESLQAFGSVNDKQRISTQTITTEKEPVLGRKESTSRNKILPKSNVQSPSQERYPKKSSQSRLSNLSQKAINYPVGYAILLREYMRNSIINGNNNGDKNVVHEREKDNNDVSNPKFNEKTTKFQRYVKNMETVPAAKSQSRIVEKTKDNHLFMGRSKSNTMVPSRPTASSKIDENTSTEIEKNSDVYFRPRYTSFLQDKSQNYQSTNEPERRASHKKERTMPASEKEKTKEVLVNRNAARKEDFRKPEEGTRSNSKHLFKSTKDVARYRFIIDPKEAVRPASGQRYTMVREQAKNNRSDIKFRHAESTIKHIKPPNRVPYESENNSKRKSFRNAGGASRVEYSDPVAFPNDHISLNSAASEVKTLQTGQSLNNRYGDRLPQRPRSTATNNNEASKSVPEKQTINFASAAQKDLRKYLYFDESKRDNENNFTYLPELLQSESQTNLAKFNNDESVALISNNKYNETALGNSTEYYFVQNGGEIRNHHLDKQMITISVRVERKAIFKNNSGIPNSSSLSSTTKNNLTAQQQIQRPLHILNSTVSKTNKTLIDTTHKQNNFSLTTDLNKAITENHSHNVTKVNKKHGGYIVSKEMPNTSQKKFNYLKNKADGNRTRSNNKPWNMPFFPGF